MKVGDKVIINLKNPDIYYDLDYDKFYYTLFNNNKAVIIKSLNPQVDKFDFKVKIIGKRNKIDVYSNELSIAKNSIRRL